MDREYLQDNLSAFIDGEMSEEDAARFEIELQKHPDLQEVCEQLRKLDKLARSRKVELPDDKYFDGLADRIEGKLPDRPATSNEEESGRRANVVDFLAANSKTVKILGSVAAVVLVALIGVQIFTPGSPEYPKDLRTIEVKPAIQTEKRDASESPAPPPEDTVVARQIQPVPEVDDDDSGGRGDAGSDAATGGDTPQESEAEPGKAAVEERSGTQLNSLELSTADNRKSVLGLEQSKDSTNLVENFSKVTGAMPQAEALSQQSMAMRSRKSIQQQREFAFTDFGYSEVPSPDEFAATVLDLYNTQSGQSSSWKGTSTVKKKEDNVAGSSLSANQSSESAQKQRVINDAETAYRIAVSDSSNVFDVIFARILAESAARVSHDKGTWARRLMELSRIEQFERQRIGTQDGQ